MSENKRVALTLTYDAFAWIGVHGALVGASDKQEIRNTREGERERERAREREIVMLACAAAAAAARQLLLLLLLPGLHLQQQQE